MEEQVTENISEMLRLVVESTALCVGMGKKSTRTEREYRVREEC